MITFAGPAINRIPIRASLMLPPLLGRGDVDIAAG
jgi:hypothetical protein